MDRVVSLYVARGGCTMYRHTRLDDPSLKPEHVGNSWFWPTDCHLPSPGRLHYARAHTYRRFPLETRTCLKIMILTDWLSSSKHGEAALCVDTHLQTNPAWNPGDGVCRSGCSWIVLFDLGFTTPTCDVAGFSHAHWFYHAYPPAPSLPAVTHTWIGSDFAFHAGARFFPQGREPEVDRQQHLSSEITARKSTIVHLVCVIIMYTIYEM